MMRRPQASENGHGGSTPSPVPRGGTESNTPIKRVTIQMGDDGPLSNGSIPYSSTLDGTNGSLRPLPGRTRRKRHHRGKREHQSFGKRFYARWIKGFATSFSSLFVAVALWYGLGVISIGTSKLLLTYHGDAVPPLTLTLQQLLIGSTLLRFLLEVRFLSSPGVLPWPLAASPATTQRRWSYVSPPPSKQQSGVIKMLQTVTGGKLVDTRLLLAGIFFSTGFLATNYGFSGAAASFVETIKAAEPITSASVAVLGGIEVLGSNEVFSLITIVAGVLLSTLGNGAGSHSNDNAVATSVQQSLKTCAIVLLANICFSYRGLYQKLFRNDPTAGALDDVNLQYRMQQIGVTMLLVPALLLEGPSIMSYWWSHGTYQAFSRFFLLSLLNGFAFTSYNLASTFILTRISVVHHAALNCLRRVFAILITSFYFVVPITFLGGVGIVLSTAGFLSFTHFKAQRQRQPKPVSSLLPISRNGSGAIPEVSLP